MPRRAAPRPGGLRHRPAAAALAAAALALSTGAGCTPRASIAVALPDDGFDLAVVALAREEADGSTTLLDHSGLFFIPEGAPPLGAEVDREARLRLVAFLYSSAELGARLSVEPEALPARLEVVRIPAGDIDLPARDPGGDRVSTVFEPTDSARPILAETEPGSAEASIAGAVAFQLRIVVHGAADAGQDSGPGPGDGASDAGSDGGLEAGLPDSSPDGGLTDGGLAALGAFTSVGLVAALSDPSATDDDPTATADLLELYFNSTRAGGPGGADVWMASRNNTSLPWGPPVPVAELNTASEETAPKVAADGLTIWLASDRPGGAGGNDIYVSTRSTRTSSWSAPALVPELNSVGNEGPGVLDSSLLVMVLNSDRPGGAGMSDLYVAARLSVGAAWGAPEPIVELNTSDIDTDGHLSPRGFYLFFASDRPGGFGERDLYVSARPKPTDPFGPPVSIPELCSGAHDTDIWLSADLRTALFSSTRTGDSEIYEASR